MRKAISKRKDIVQKSLSYKNRNEEIRLLAEMVNADYLHTINHCLQSRGIPPSRLARDIGVSR